MAQDEAAAATTPLEVATHFPGSSGIRLPTDQTIGIDASKLFDVIARMGCLLYTSPSPRDMRRSRMPSSA